MPAPTATVESFRIVLGDFAGLPQEADPVQAVESALLAQLESPVRLLRWAIVQVDPDRRHYRCEGAYLKSSRPGQVVLD